MVIDRRSASGGVHACCSVAKSLHILPKFDDDTFFALFEHVAEVRGWPDSHKILKLQCVFTGKAQRAFSALSSAESGDYEKVRLTVLKAYELVPVAYRQRYSNWRKGSKQT